MRKVENKAERFKESLAEAEDLLNSMGAGLLKLARGMADKDMNPDVLNGVFRAAHTLKGMAGIIGFKELARLSHSTEDVLDMLRHGKISLNTEVLSVLMGAHELLLKMLSSKRGADFAAELETTAKKLSDCASQRAPKQAQAIDKEIRSLLTDYEAHRFSENAASGKNIFILTFSFSISDFEKDYAAVIESLRRHSEVISTLPSRGAESESLYFDIIVGTREDAGFITEISKAEGRKGFVECRTSWHKGSPVKPLSAPSTRQSQLPPARHAMPPPAAADRPEALQTTMRRVSSTVRVDIARLDAIMNIVSELGILKGDIQALSAALRNEMTISVYGIELAKAERVLERKLGELRDSVLDVRMVKIGTLFSRYEPFVENLSRESGKQVRMTTRGDETELDKLIIEELADPLMHIIRNAVDHAIEGPQARAALGKDALGELMLSAYQKGNHVVVEVKDDGAGIDEEAVKERAVSTGALTRDYVNGLSRQEVIDLIFMPGFSTRDSVSATSGRGVGMDVVKENISRLGGVIDIETVKGKGTRIMLTIPITLAIIQALIVEDAGVRYAVPLNPVVEIVEFDGKLLDGAQPLDAPAAEHKGIPQVRLRDFFRRKAPYGPPPSVCYGIVAGMAEHSICVIVERLIEELDIVIKPIPRIVKTPGVAGATDMGEKGTLLVLDMSGILEQSSRESRLKEASH